jgi:hypothetical protein
MNSLMSLLTLSGNKFKMNVFIWLYKRLLQADRDRYDFSQPSRVSKKEKFPRFFVPVRIENGESLTTPEDFFARYILPNHSAAVTPLDFKKEAKSNLAWSCFFSTSDALADFSYHTRIVRHLFASATEFEEFVSDCNGDYECFKTKVGEKMQPSERFRLLPAASKSSKKNNAEDDKGDEDNDDSDEEAPSRKKKKESNTTSTVASNVSFKEYRQQPQKKGNILIDLSATDEDPEIVKGLHEFLSNENWGLDALLKKPDWKVTVQIQQVKKENPHSEKKK